MVGMVLVGVRRRAVLGLLGIHLTAFGQGAVDAGVRARDGRDLAMVARAVPRCSIEGKVLEEVGALGALLDLERISCDLSGGGGVAVAREAPGPPGMRFAGDALLLPLGDDGVDLLLERLGARARLHDVTIVSSDPPEGIWAVAETVRSALERATANAGSHQGALLRGLTVGDTTGLDATDIERFRRSGLSHIVAVSGSNVAIVLGTVMFLVGALDLRTRVVVAAAALGLFVVVVGPDPSVLRAAAMGAIALATALAGYRAGPLNSLGLAVMAVVALRPGMVWAVGLYLSVAATAGLIVFMGPIARRLHRLPVPVAALVAATVAAQLAVLPILGGVFGEVSVIAPLANILAIPAVAPATILGLAAGCLGLVWPTGGAAVARMASPFAGWILWVARTTGDWDGAVVPLPRTVVWALAGLLGIAAWAALRQPIASGS
jgi:ComEC/Rec2-related protein